MMLFLSKVKFSNKKNTLSMKKESGMVLFVVLWVIILVTMLISHLFSLIQLNTQLGLNAILRAQQFEAVEAALLLGEKKLAQHLSNISNLENHFYFELSSEVCQGHYVHLNAKRLPQAFCISPFKKGISGGLCHP